MWQNIGGFTKLLAGESPLGKKDISQANINFSELTTVHQICQYFIHPIICHALPNLVGMQIVYLCLYVAYCVHVCCAM